MNLLCVGSAPQTSAPDIHTMMVGNVKNIHHLDNGTPSFAYPWALQNNVLYHGDMLEADDQPKFVTVMGNKINGL